MQQMFGPSNANIKPKIKAEVKLGLSDGTTLRGNLFISPSERIIDTLNDSRGYLPFERSDGLVRVLSKSIITSITLIEPELEKAPSKPKAVDAA